MLNCVIVLLIGTLTCAGGWYWWSAIRTLPDAIDHTIQPLLIESLKEPAAPFLAQMDFMLDVQFNDAPAAYLHTTKRFQSCQSLEVFAEFLERHRELRSGCVNLECERPNAELCIFRIATESKEGKRFAFTLQLRLEDEKWKVDEMIMPPGEDHGP
jgi:hypothetical protein